MCGEGHSSEYYSRREVRVYYNASVSFTILPSYFPSFWLADCSRGYSTVACTVLVILPHHNGLMRFPSPFFVFFFVAVLHEGTKSVHYRFS